MRFLFFLRCSRKSGGHTYILKDIRVRLDVVILILSNSYWCRKFLQARKNSNDELYIYIIELSIVHAKSKATTKTKKMTLKYAV